MAELEKTAKVTRLSESLRWFEVPDFASVMLQNWSFLHLSCMVIGRPLFETIRFEAELRLAAEDVLFFCDCAIAAKRVDPVQRAGAVRGEGVNIFHSIDNDSPQFLSQQFNTWVALDTLEERFSRRPAGNRFHPLLQAYAPGDRRCGARRDWSSGGKMPQFGLLARWVWRDPRCCKVRFSLPSASYHASFRSCSILLRKRTLCKSPGMSCYSVLAMQQGDVMKPYYWESQHGNFGDDLNLWLWDFLLPGFRDVHAETLLVGVGTVLNRVLLPEEAQARPRQRLRLRHLAGYERQKRMGYPLRSRPADGAEGRP